MGLRRMLDRLPWDLSPETLARFAPGRLGPGQGRGWELYYLPDDFSQAKDLAAEHPDKVAELKELFWEEAERNRVLPLMAGSRSLRDPAAAADAHPVHLRAATCRTSTAAMIPRIYGRSYAIEADLASRRRRRGRHRGRWPTSSAGSRLWVDERRHAAAHATRCWASRPTGRPRTAELPTGDVSTCRCSSRPTQATPGTAARHPLRRTTSRSARATCSRPSRSRSPATPAWTSAATTASVVDRDYEDQAPYAFTGTVKKVVFDLTPGTHEDEKKPHVHDIHQTVAAGIAG